MLGRQVGRVRCGMDVGERVVDAKAATQGTCACVGAFLERVPCAGADGGTQTEAGLGMGLDQTRTTVCVKGRGGTRSQWCKGGAGAQVRAGRVLMLWQQQRTATPHLEAAENRQLIVTTDDVAARFAIPLLQQHETQLVRKIDCR